MTRRRSKLPSSFWRHFSASTTSNLGDGVIAAAAPLLALSLTDDTRLLGAVSFAAMLPWLVLTLPAGVYIDRHSRKTIMSSANVVRAVLFATLSLLVLGDRITIWILLLVVLCIAVCEVLFDMSAQAFLPEIVAESQLETANGRLYAAEVVANSFVGLPIGAWLFVIAAAAPFGIQAIALMIAATLLFSIRTSAASTGSGTGEVVHTRGGFRADLTTGLRWLWSHKLLRLLALMLGAANMCHMFAQSVYAKFVRDELGLGPRGFGFLLASGAIGSIVGGLLGSRVASRLGSARAIVVAYAMFATLEFVPWLLPRVWSVVLAGVAMAIFGTVWNVLTVSLRQRLIPPELFGRVNSVYRFLGTGTSAIGAIVGGQIAFYFGLRATYLVSGLALSMVLAVGAPSLLRYAKRYMAPERTPAPPSMT